MMQLFSDEVKFLFFSMHGNKGANGLISKCSAILVGNNK